MFTTSSLHSVSRMIHSLAKLWPSSLVSEAFYHVLISDARGFATLLRHPAAADEAVR